MRNLITDVAGLAVGHADDARLASGVTAILFEPPAVAAVDVRGGGPGSRETDLLRADRTVPGVNAIVLSGGSAFGLDSAAGVMAWVAGQGRGYGVGSARVPIVPGVVLFDLLNGGDKAWGRFPPYRDLGFAAAEAASDTFRLGTVGAGLGANSADLKGGLGSASAVTSSGHTVGAIVAVNAIGSLTIADTPHFWAGAHEQNAEFGGLGLPTQWPADATRLKLKRLVSRNANTTIGVVATDAELTKAETQHLAVMAQDGLALAIRPVHTPLDGDTVFATATGRLPLADRLRDIAELGATAAAVLARACARAVFEATALPFDGALPAWRDRFGQPNRVAP